MNFLNLASWLAEAGQQVGLWITTDSEAIIAQAEKLKLKIFQVKPASKYLAIGSGRGLSREFREKGIGLVYFSYGPDLDPLSWMKAFSPEIKLVYMQQMQLGVAKKNPYQAWRFSKLDKWIAPLDWLSKEAKELTGFSQTKIEEIPLCQDFKGLLGQNEERQKLKEEIGISNETVLMGCLGRLDPAKGIEVVIESLSLIRKQFPNVELLVMGENTRDMPGDHKETLIELSEQLELRDFVHFLPFSDKVSEFFRSIDLFVMASERETFGMVTVEAMATGLLVFGSDSGGTPELLDQGRAGVLFDQGKAESLSSKVLDYLEGPDKYRDIKILGKKRAMENYSSQVVVDQHIELIESL